MRVTSTTILLCSFHLKQCISFALIIAGHLFANISFNFVVAFVYFEQFIFFFPLYLFFFFCALFCVIRVQHPKKGIKIFFGYHFLAVCFGRLSEWVSECVLYAVCVCVFRVCFYLCFYRLIRFFCAHLFLLWDSFVVFFVHF